MTTSFPLSTNLNTLSADEAERIALHLEANTSQAAYAANTAIARRARRARAVADALAARG